jgi:membrane-associated phospholipid phosphatase
VPAVWDQLGVPTAQSIYENGDFVNPVAAMPSLHAAFPLMLLLFFWSAGRWMRLALGLYTLAMAFTLVYGGEHFAADILAGWAMALGVHALVGIGVRRAPALFSATSRAPPPARAS